MRTFHVSVPAVVFMAAMAWASASTLAAEDYSSTIDKFKSSDQVKPFFENAYGYAVFPLIGKGGLGVGGAYGQGQVYRDGKVTGKSKLLKVSFGFQAGGQGFCEIIFFKDQRAYEEFTGGNFAFDATASAVAITAGAQATTGTTGGSAGVSAGPASGKQVALDYHKGMAVFTQAIGGLMYEAAIGGQKFSFDPL